MAVTASRAQKSAVAKKATQKQAPAKTGRSTPRAKPATAKPKPKKPKPKKPATEKPKPKKPATAKPKPKKPATAKPKPKKPATAKPKKAAATRAANLARPSERSMAASALLPRDERALDDLERSAMAKVAAKALGLLGAARGTRTPAEEVLRIARYVDDVRSGAAAPPRDRDELFGLGVLWGEQLRAQVGWLWVHLTYDGGLSSFALVPDDRAFAVFPIDRMLELLGPDEHAPARSATNTLAGRFDAICGERLPARHPNAYLVIG